VCVSWTSNEAAARAVADEVGGRAVRADVADEADVLSRFAAADELGPVTALVANAGIVARTARLDEIPADRMRRMLDVNVLGVMLTAREAVRRMSTRHGGAGGSIVTVGSLASRLGSPGVYVDYAASKGAVDTFTLGLAREVASEGVRVNVVRPGIIDTEIHASGGEPDRAAQIGAQAPMQRPGTADEVAAAIMWLLSDEASYTTGAILDVGGGR
jgi:NAD(P)-dependent dehydrogenase (short-subunit alcohol dehydrogenase family)